MAQRILDIYVRLSNDAQFGRPFVTSTGAAISDPSTVLVAYRRETFTLRVHAKDAAGTATADLSAVSGARLTLKNSSDTDGDALVQVVADSVETGDAADHYLVFTVDLNTVEMNDYLLVQTGSRAVQRSRDMLAEVIELDGDDNEVAIFGQGTWTVRRDIDQGDEGTPLYANSPKHQPNGTAAPTVDDDSTLGYGVGSIWCYGTTVWINRNPAAGAAVWEELATQAATALTTTGALTAVNGLHVVLVSPSITATLPAANAYGVQGILLVPISATAATVARAGSDTIEAPGAAAGTSFSIGLNSTGPVLLVSDGSSKWYRGSSVPSNRTITAGDGLQGGGDLSADRTLAVDVSDFAGTGLEDDGSENLRIAAAAAGNGLIGGGGSALAVQADSTTGGDTAPVSVGANGVGLDVSALDGDHLDVDFTPSNYSPSASPSEAADVDDLAAHLAGIDAKLGTLTNSLVYKGTWNANTNTPTLADGTGAQGEYYRVSVAGTTSIDGEADWSVGDWIVFNGTAWEKADNTTKLADDPAPQLADDLDADDNAITELGGATFSDEATVAIASGSATLTAPINILQAETGTADSLTDLPIATGLRVVRADAGDTITIPDHGSDVANKIRTSNGLAMTLRPNAWVALYRKTTSDVWRPIGGVGGADVLNNYTATVPPTTGDDAAAGYTPGSEWIDTVLGTVHKCVGDGLWVCTSDASPVGTIIWYPSDTAPAGYLLMGPDYSRTTYAALYAKIGNTLGEGDGSTTFGTGDINTANRFIRGADGTTYEVGDTFDDAMQGHIHQQALGGSLTTTNITGGSGIIGQSNFQNTEGPISDGTNGTPRIAAETRPKGIALVAYIKYADSSGGGSLQPQRTGVYRYMPLPIAAWKPDPTNPPTVTDDPAAVFDVLAFDGTDDGSADQAAWIPIDIDEDMDASEGFRLELKIRAPVGCSASEVARFTIAAASYDHDDALPADLAGAVSDLGSAVNLDVTVTAAGDLLTVQSATVTPGGSPAVGDLMLFRLARDYDYDNSGGDTEVSEPVQIVSARLQYKETTVEPEGWS